MNMFFIEVKEDGFEFENLSLSKMVTKNSSVIFLIFICDIFASCEQIGSLSYFSLAFHFGFVSLFHSFWHYQAPSHL